MKYMVLANLLQNMSEYCQIVCQEIPQNDKVLLMRIEMIHHNREIEDVVLTIKAKW